MDFSRSISVSDSNLVWLAAIFLVAGVGGALAAYARAGALEASHPQQSLRWALCARRLFRAACCAAAVLFVSIATAVFVIYVTPLNPGGSATTAIAKIMKGAYSIEAVCLLICMIIALEAVSSLVPSFLGSASVANQIDEAIMPTQKVGD